MPKLKSIYVAKGYDMVRVKTVPAYLYRPTMDYLFQTIRNEALLNKDDMYDEKELREDKEFLVQLREDNDWVLSLTDDFKNEKDFEGKKDKFEYREILTIVDMKGNLVY